MIVLYKDLSKILKEYKITNKEKDIDESYYRYLVDNAIEAISNFGDYEQFID